MTGGSGRPARGFFVSRSLPPPAGIAVYLRSIPLSQWLSARRKPYREESRASLRRDVDPVPARNPGCRRRRSRTRRRGHRRRTRRQGPRQPGRLRIGSADPGSDHGPRLRTVHRQVQHLRRSGAPGEMTADLQALRDQALSEARGRGLPASRDLVTKGVRFGRITARPDGTLDTSEVQGVSPDLIVRPFHQKGAVVSLREFTVSAFNHHHGMQAVERFGRARTGTDDFDEDGVPDELTVGDITAATIFQATLNTPGRVIPRDPGKVRAIERGQSTFETIGCAECHRPALVLNNRMFSEPDPYNPPGNLRPEDVSRPVTFDLTRDGQLPRPERLPDGRALVRAYTDLKRHDLCDAEIDHFCNERVVQGGISTRQFLTRKLSDVGNSAPYGHRGDLTTITEAILAHGGEGRVARDAFGALPKERRDELVEFLKSLQILPEGTPTLVVHERGPAAGDAGSFQ